MTSELHELIADVRRLLEADAARGIAAFHVSGALEAELPEPEPQVEVVAPPPAPSPRRDDWGAIAKGARDTAVPLWSSPAGAAAADGVGQAGLDAIRADLGACERCGLCAGRKNIVFGVGDADADLMVIGEGPGEQEDLTGEPFVGAAGQMLDKMLENVLGLPRPKVYIANVVKCRPPENRNPTPEEAAICKPFLERQIRAVQPKILLVLGGVALSQVLGINGITRARGKEVRWKEIPAIPTFHPAYLLRSPGDKKLTFEDLKLLLRRYDELGGRR